MTLPSSLFSASGTRLRQRRQAAFVLGILAAALVGFAALQGGGVAAAREPQRATNAAKAPAAAAEVQVGFGAEGLPANVAEMREAILAAALSGDVDELIIPIQWNELPPDLGEKPAKETLGAWKRQSHDGSGREMLALLADILTAPYAVRRQGPDVENAMVYIWPAFAELPLKNLPPALEVALLRVVSPEEARRMKRSGAYDGYGLAIGADGTWHAFKRVTQAPTDSKK